MSDFDGLSEEEEDDAFAPVVASSAEDEEASQDEDDDGRVSQPGEDGPNVLYISWNRTFHRISRSDGVRPGWKRFYNRPAMVKDAVKLSEMVSDTRSWPRGSALLDLVSAEKVVVVFGRTRATRDGEADPPPLQPIWYVLLEVAGVAHKQDHLILRHIPKPVYIELLQALKDDPQMAGSSLLKMEAHQDNIKALSPVHNNFSKVVKGEEPRTSCFSFKDKKKDAEASRKSKKADDAVPKTSSVSSFWKPRPTAAEAPTNEGAADSVETERTSSIRPSCEKTTEKAVAEKADAAENDAANKAAKAKRAAPERPGAAMVKKRRVESIESFEFELSGASAMDFVIPEGATAGKATFVWKFD